jgi:acetoacetate decarboxylase
MGFVKDLDELERISSIGTAEFFDAEMVTVYWETKPEIIARLLPPPLEPVERPLVSAFIANYPLTNFSLPYKEAALFISAKHKGDVGGYCLAMPVTNDMAMSLGREKYGFPKKMADISFKRDGDIFSGYAQRLGVNFFNLKVQLNSLPNEKDFSIVLDEASAGNTELSAVYNFKSFMGPSAAPFDYNPRLIRAEVKWRPEVTEFGSAEVEMTPSPADPWADVEIVRLIGAVYTRGHNTLCDGEVVAENDMFSFVPYSFLRWDF